ncbi:MAG: EAL domain-containing protein [Polyangiaceae bacterium]|nr:EAL domain-containing protein [Polyangiaceae bacterium]
MSGLDAGILETAVHFARRLGFRVDGALCKPADILDVGRLLDNLGRRRSGRPGGSQQSLTQESSARCLEAIRNGELFLRYQPQIDLATGRTTGAEALVRWNHPEQGELQPLTFVPLLEEGGAASELAQYVLLRALSDTRQLRQTWPAFRVSVNVHASVLRAPEFVERLLSALRTENMPAGALCIEATETAIVDDAPDTLENLVKLRMAGVQLSIDDFGTGHSTLQQLLRLPVNEIKLDRSFVSRLETSAKSRALTHGVLHIAAALGASVVAEGIETSEVHATLREMGCGIGQGYLFARPLTLDALTSWLGQHVP